MIQVLQQLNGIIYFVKGNHDKAVKKPEPSAYFQWMKDYYELPIQDKEMDHKHKIVLCHYAFEVWNKKHFGAWHPTKGDECPMARASQLFDPLNRFSLDAIISPKDRGERQLAALHFQHLNQMISFCLTEVIQPFGYFVLFCH